MGDRTANGREWTRMEARVRGAEGINQPQVKKDVLMEDEDGWGVVAEA